jgi:hypothetical protein
MLPIFFMATWVIVVSAVFKPGAIVVGAAANAPDARTDVNIAAARIDFIMIGILFCDSQDQNQEMSLASPLIFKRIFFGPRQSSYLPLSLAPET